MKKKIRGCQRSKQRAPDFEKVMMKYEVGAADEIMSSAISGGVER